jgi:hypothetical protein
MRTQHYKSLLGVVILRDHALSALVERVSLFGLNPNGVLKDFDRTAMRVLILDRERVVLRKRAGWLVFERYGKGHYEVKSFVPAPHLSDRDDLFIEDEEGLKKTGAA